jgi:transcriptional regulator with XRE-family HTH domain
MTVSEQLIEAIEACGVSRHRLSQETGVSESALSRFVRGERGIGIGSVDALAEHLGRTLVPADPLPAKGRGARQKTRRAAR